MHQEQPLPSAHTDSAIRVIVVDHPDVPDESAAMADIPSGERSQITQSVQRLAPYALAVCVAMISLRGAFHSDIATTDAARHAMNGALIHDWICSGQFTHPVDYAKQYYVHLPSTSIPYHPPMFPAIEACLFRVFGVHVFVARVAMALAVVACALLLFRRVAKDYGSHLLALATVVSFFSLKGSIVLSSDVMLEFPAFAFALASLGFLRLVDGQWRLRDGLLFAALGGAAVWTKQHAVFVGLVPFVYIVLSRRWYLFRGKTFWISTVVFSTLVAGLLTTMPSGVGGTSQVLGNSVYVTLSRTIQYYPKSYIRILGIVPGSVCALTFVVLLLKRLSSSRGSGQHDLMLSWAISVFVMLLFLRQFSGRYMIFALPPMITLGYYGVAEMCRIKLSDNAVRGVVLACLALVAVPNMLLLTGPTRMLRGPGDAARYVVGQGATRVLYCGYFGGSFIFAVRSLGEPMERWVLLGNKLDALTFEPKSLKAFIDRYGVEYVVFEQTSVGQPWDRLAVRPIPSLCLEKVIALENTSSARRSGSLYVFRNLTPSLEPADPTHLQLSTIGSYLGKFTDVQRIIETMDDKGNQQNHLNSSGG